LTRRVTLYVWGVYCGEGGGGTRMQTLSCSKGSVIKALEAGGRRLDVDGYNALGPAVAGHVRIEGNKGLRADGESEISFARELPEGWNSMDREMVPAHTSGEGGGVGAEEGGSLREIRSKWA
jgi:hypothetical protein